MAFWDWWAREGRTAASMSISGQLEPERFANEMSERVQPLGHLGWELAGGETTEHVLVITASGDPAGRALARRIVLAAPDADAVWSYADTRPPVADPTTVVLSAAGTEVDLVRVTVAARMSNRRFDVQVHHPAFADMPVEARLQVSILALEAALGEVDAELWVAEVSPIEFTPLDGFGLLALRSVVHDLKRQQLDQDGQPGWVMLRGETESGPLVAMARSPLHAATAPHLDTYVSVALPYSHRTADGLPDEGSLEPLSDLEARLEHRLGTVGQVVAHLSTAGVRTLHLYVDSTAEVMAAVGEVAGTWDQGEARVHEMHDPGWQAVGHLRG